MAVFCLVGYGVARAAEEEPTVGNAPTILPSAVSSATPSARAPELGRISQEKADAAITTTLRGLDPGLVSEVKVGAAPEGATNLPGQWVYATLKADSDKDGAFLKAEWEAYLAQGAIADRIAGSATDLVNVISGSTFMLDAPGLSAPEKIGGGAGDASAGQVFGAARESDQSIEASVTKTLAEFGITHASVSVLHPLGPAIAVKAALDDKATLDGKFEEFSQALKANGAYEGVFVELDDAKGQPLVREGSAERASAGVLWFADGADTKLGIVHGALPGTE